MALSRLWTLKSDQGQLPNHGASSLICCSCSAAGPFGESSIWYPIRFLQVLISRRVWRNWCWWDGLHFKIAIAASEFWRAHHITHHCIWIGWIHWLPSCCWSIEIEDISRLHYIITIYLASLDKARKDHKNSSCFRDLCSLKPMNQILFGGSFSDELSPSNLTV
jgi:hypothetical protein